MIYGSIPAGGKGSRLQPLGFSKELAPIAGRAVIEYLIGRMRLAGIDKIFINTSPDKTDLITYLSTKSEYKDNLVFIVRERKGLLDAVVSPHEFIKDDDYLVFGLPDTIWFPEDAFKQIIEFKNDSDLTLGLFDSGKPESYDSVVTGNSGLIKSIEVKVPSPKSIWTWGIGMLRAGIASELLRLGEKQVTNYPLFGTAMHDFAKSHDAYAVELKDSSYIDIGTPEDFEKARELYK